MPLDRFDVLDPERSDDVLGDGWQWSTRHLLQVQNEGMRLRIERGNLWFKFRGSNQPAILVNNGGTRYDGWLVLKMIMITKEPDAISELVERFNSK